MRTNEEILEKQTLSQEIEKKDRLEDIESDEDPEGAEDPEGTEDPEGAEEPGGAEDIEGDEDYNYKVTDEELEYALSRAGSSLKDERDCLNCMSGKEFNDYAQDLWKNDRGLIYDQHEVTDRRLEYYEAKQKEGTITDEEKILLNQLKAEKKDYEITGKQFSDSSLYPENNGFWGEPKEHSIDAGEILVRYEDIGKEVGAGSYCAHFANISENNYLGENKQGDELPTTEQLGLIYDPSKKEVHYFRIEEGSNIKVLAGDIQNIEGTDPTGGKQYFLGRENTISEYIREGKMYECDAEGRRIKSKDDDK